MCSGSPDRGSAVSTNDRSEPTSEDVRTAIEESGYLFEQKLALVLEKSGWVVTPNVSFEDQDTDTSREIDLEAIEALPISQKRREYLFSIIGVSAKRNTFPYVFLTREALEPGTILGEHVIFSGFPLTIADDSVERSIQDFLGLSRISHHAHFHRYGTQFCMVKPKGKKWQASHERIYDDLIVPLIKWVEAACPPTSILRPDDGWSRYT